MTAVKERIAARTEVEMCILGEGCFVRKGGKFLSVGKK